MNIILKIINNRVFIILALVGIALLYKHFYIDKPYENHVNNLLKELYAKDSTTQITKQLYRKMVEESKDLEEKHIKELNNKDEEVIALVKAKLNLEDQLIDVKDIKHEVEIDTITNNKRDIYMLGYHGKLINMNGYLKTNPMKSEFKFGLKPIEFDLYLTINKDNEDIKNAYIRIPDSLMNEVGVSRLKVNVKKNVISNPISWYEHFKLYTGAKLNKSKLGWDIGINYKNYTLSYDNDSYIKIAKTWKLF